MSSKTTKEPKPLYQNKWCKIINKDTFYVLQSKTDKYKDQYFLTLSDALASIGIGGDRLWQVMEDIRKTSNYPD